MARSSDLATKDVALDSLSRRTKLNLMLQIAFKDLTHIFRKKTDASLVGSDGEERTQQPPWITCMDAFKSCQLLKAKQT